MAQLKTTKVREQPVANVINTVSNSVSLNLISSFVANDVFSDWFPWQWYKSLQFLKYIFGKVAVYG